jgi:histidinol-phosphate/aromatic aminotransferase/cobyric acid decarboxylase-like protein
MLDDPEIKAKRLEGQLWYEIDDIQDLDIATSMFAPDQDEKLALVQGRYGGYWRYPQLVDFCYLVNPYFPPKKLTDEIKASFETLLMQYPSGMRVNSLLAAKNFSVHSENIVVGNGAAELIKAMMAQMDGKTGFIRPTFEEYPNRSTPEQVVCFQPQNADYSYSAADLMEFFEDKEIRNLVVVNPDNPSGNYIPKADVLKLVAWAKAKSIRLLIDESFVDFAEEENSTLINQTILDSNPHLYVMKSISKSYGVPGLRLGILATGDTEQIARLKKDVAIWNINSFAEFYMQIEEKYKKDYAQALVLIREERARFQRKLSEIPGIRVIPSQANYIMVELTGNISARELTKRLLIQHNLFVKNLAGKIHTGQYLRLAVRNTADNDKLLAALKEELKARH